jgi:phospholipid/cholesterol/gamma-HCH transport system substrate-binding protein
MKQNNYFEIIVGTFVLICAGLFFFNSVKSANIKTGYGYHLSAKFDDAGGIEAGSDVKMSGIKIGTVEKNTLDAKTYRAQLFFSVDKDVKLPTDSSAKIVSSGLLGEKFLELSPGADEEFLSDGQEIIYTQSSINFEQLLGKFMFSNKDEKKDEKKKK